MFIDTQQAYAVALRAQREHRLLLCHLRGYLDAYGCPEAFESDKHSVFQSVNRAPKAIQARRSSACASELTSKSYARTSQAKGRVKRANRTLQDRLHGAVAMALLPCLNIDSKHA